MQVETHRKSIHYWEPDDIRFYQQKIQSILHANALVFASINEFPSECGKADILRFHCSNGQTRIHKQFIWLISLWKKYNFSLENVASSSSYVMFAKCKQWISFCPLYLPFAFCPWICLRIFAAEIMLSWMGDCERRFNGGDVRIVNESQKGRWFLLKHQRWLFDFELANVTRGEKRERERERERKRKKCLWNSLENENSCNLKISKRDKWTLLVWKIAGDLFETKAIAKKWNKTGQHCRCKAGISEAIVAMNFVSIRLNWFHFVWIIKKVMIYFNKRNGRFPLRIYASRQEKRPETLIEAFFGDFNLSVWRAS